MGDTDACPSSAWRKLPFLPSATTPGFNPAQWTAAQYTDYARGTLLGATSVNLAFLALPVLLLLLVLLWRILGCLGRCCRGCCGIRPGLRARKSLLSYEVMHDPWLRGHKVSLTFFSTACIVLAATGLATLPRANVLINDLATRLEAASTFSSSLLAASDGLQVAAAGMRPLMEQTAAVLQANLSAQSMATDMTCTSSLLDSTFAAPTSPVALRVKLLAADAALRNGVAPALAAAAALLNLTASGPAAASPALSVVAAMPKLVSNLSDALSAYDTALASMPASRQPTTTSSPAVAALQAAQAGLNLSQYITSLNNIYDSVRIVAAAAQQVLYTQLAAALQALRNVSANSSADPLSPLAKALGRLDTLYLGTDLVQQQQMDSSTAGRACLTRLASALTNFDQAIFRFNGTLERTAISAVLAVQVAMDRLYDVNTTTVTLNGSAPAPVASGTSRAMLLLAPLAAMDGSAVTTQCAAVQSALSYPNGSSALPDHTPTLNYLLALRAALVALLQPSANVAVAASGYVAAPSASTYANLYNTSNATRGASANAASAAAAPLPLGANAIASAAANASAAAGGPLQTALLGVQGAVVQAADWLAAYDPGSVALNRSALALAQLQSVFDKTQARLLASGWNASVSAAGGTGGSSNVSLVPSAFLQPLKQSIAVLSSSVSNGLAAIAEQLDNALGKVITSPSPPTSASPPPAAHRLLQQEEQRVGASLDNVNSSTFTGSFLPTNRLKPVAPTGANATALVRWQLVRRLDLAVATLRGERTATITKAYYWTGVAVYAAVITSCVLLGLAAFFNFPGGLLALLVLLLLLAGIVLLLAWMAAAGLVGLRDACGSADYMVLSSVAPSTPLYPLVRYYLQGVGASLSVVLRTAGLGDTARLGTAAQLVHDQLLDPLLLPARPGANATISNATSPMDVWPGSLGTVQYGVGGVLLDMGAAATSVSANLTNMLRLGDRASVMTQYTSVTSWACCGLASQVFMAWIAATGCGLVAWLAAVSAMCLFKNLDDMPTKRCCGCMCYDPKDYPRPQRQKHRNGSSGGGAGSSPSSSTYTGGSWAKSGSPQPARPGMLASAYGSGFGASGATANCESPRREGKDTGLKEVVVENGLFQGPVTASISPAAGTGEGAWRQRPAISVCVMDQATAAAFGYGDEGGVEAAPVPAGLPTIRQ